MSDFEQVTFLGATVRQFNCNLGWGKETTTVSISLVEDESNGDRFNKPGIFSLAYFRFYNFDYYGIVTNIEESKGQDGNVLLSVVLNDPRQFLSGVHLILDGYNGGVFNVPNLYNIYGYLENIEFGYSQRVSGGIPYSKVREGLLALINTVPINYRGVTYQIDLSGLPNIPGNYLISAKDLTLIDFIDEICEVANYDYIVELAGNTIQFLTVNRNQVYSPGSVQRYVDRKTGYSSSSVNLQGEYNTINKFIVGPSREDLFFQHFNNDQDPEALSDNYISNFWGFDRFGNIILPNELTEEYVEKYGNIYSVTVEGFSITDQIYLQNPVSSTLNGPTHDTIPRNFINGYTFDVGELRAALISREAWESYIIFNDYIVPNDSPIKKSVHEGKVKKIELLFGEVARNGSLNLIFENRPLAALNPVEITALKNAAAVTPFNLRDSYIQRVYEFVRSYAENYYGVKIMVRIPFLTAKYNEYGDVETSFEPSESGYIDESLYLDVVRKNLMPFYVDLVKNTDNKIEPYVRYDASTQAFLADGTFEPNHTGLDISNIPADQYYIGNTRLVEDNDGNPDTNIHINSLFIKTTIDPKVVFVNKARAIGPRVVINLPGKVFINGGDSGPEFTLRNLLAKKGLNKGAINKEVLDFKSKVGQDALVFGGAPSVALPLLSVFPMRNNLVTYGPWYTQNGQGKVEFIKDDEMAPWNFGGFNNLNQAANILVSNMSEARFFGEGGTIEFAGIPDIKLGRQILVDGPIISNMSCGIDSGGVVTRYTLGRWDQKAGRNNKYLVDQFKKSNDVKKEVDKIRKEINKPVAPIVNSVNLRLASKEFFPRRRFSNSSSQLISSDISAKPNYEFINGIETPVSGSEEFYQSSTAVMPFYTAIDHLRDENWKNKGGATLDSLFRPYSTNTNASGISHFESPNGNNTVDVNSLNPFKAGHDIQSIFYGDTVPEELARPSFTDGQERDYRPVALKGPLVLTGWGFDTENKPVPSVKDDPANSGVVPSGQSDEEFMSGYLHRSDQWKTGPVDLRWDRDRKVWVSNVGEKVIVKNSEFVKGLESISGQAYVYSSECGEYDIVDGVLKGIPDTGGTLYNVNQAELPSNSWCVALKKSANEYIYCEGGKVLRNIVTSISLTNNELVAHVTPSYVYSYSGESFDIIIGGSGCP